LQEIASSRRIEALPFFPSSFRCLFSAASVSFTLRSTYSSSFGHNYTLMYFCIRCEQLIFSWLTPALLFMCIDTLKSLYITYIVYYIISYEYTIHIIHKHKLVTKQKKFQIVFISWVVCNGFFNKYQINQRF